LKNVFEKIASLIKSKLEVNNTIREHALEISKIRGNIQKSKPIKEVKVFIKKCLDSECRGFLSTSWKCGLCDKYFCNDCHKQKQSRDDEDHKCDETEKATVAMLKKDTKPCPQCGMPIDRYTGCSQVWTPCCKIAFNWNTGEIEKGRIHSPEYYDYLRRTEGFVPREREDNVCGGNVGAYELSRTLINENKKSQNINLCLRYCRIMDHINLMIIPTLPTTPDTFDKDDLGIRYLLNEIDEEKWKFELKKRIKKAEKNNNILNILAMYTNVMNDLLRNLMDNKRTTIFINDANKLTEYANEHIIKIQKRYKSVDRSFYIRV
jgi:hypothetical protein